jgi:hypothetical protein
MHAARKEDCCRSASGNARLPRSPPLSHVVLCLFQGGLSRPAKSNFKKLLVEHARKSSVTKRTCCPGRAKQAVETRRIELQ